MYVDGGFSTTALGNAAASAASKDRGRLLATAAVSIPSLGGWHKSQSRHRAFVRAALANGDGAKRGSGAGSTCSAVGWVDRHLVALAQLLIGRHRSRAPAGTAGTVPESHPATRGSSSDLRARPPRYGTARRRPRRTAPTCAGATRRGAEEHRHHGRRRRPERHAAAAPPQLAATCSPAQRGRHLLARTVASPACSCGRVRRALAGPRRAAGGAPARRP